MPVAERLAADPGREQELAGVVDREAPAIAGMGDDAHVAGAGQRAGEIEQPTERGPAPALGRVEATGAVERRDQLVVAIEIGGRELRASRATSPSTESA